MPGMVRQYAVELDTLDIQTDMSMQACVSAETQLVCIEAQATIQQLPRHNRYASRHTEAVKWKNGDLVSMWGGVPKTALVPGCWGKAVVQTSELGSLCDNT